MQAAIFEGPGKLTIKDNHPKPSITKPDQALIRVTGVGICGTDLHILQEPPVHPARTGIVLGHEFTGVIEELGDDVQGFDVGESVLIDPASRLRLLRGVSPGSAGSMHHALFHKRRAGTSRYRRYFLRWGHG
jgi:threonine dehydrogenase-like Zn-dependent dehydrogenase